MLNPICGTLERYLDLLAVRQRLVSSNIANADTPGYRTRDIDFAEELQAVRGDALPMIKEVGDLAVKNDGNNVSLDREARLLAENGMRFQLASQLIKSEMRAVRMAIQEGREL